MENSVQPHKSQDFPRCPAHIRIGTRGSLLAVAQAQEVKNRLLGAFPELTQEQISLVKIQTSGDRIQDRSLAEIGGKGLFTKELEDALFSGAIDMAVHSMKDLPDTLPAGLIITCVLEREDPRDAFLSPRFASVEDLPPGALVGTSSTRRAAQLLMRRPDLRIAPFRGNVGTRLAKLERGEADATMLAVAGLKRLDMGDRVTAILDPDFMLPAVAQGAIGVECLEKNKHIREVLAAVHHDSSGIRIAAERAFLQAMGGSCVTPLAGFAEFTADGGIRLRGLLASPDGKTIHRVERNGAARDAAALGADAGKELARAGKELLR